MAFSRTTLRKILIIEENLGSDWQHSYPDISIDTLYKSVIGDKRASIYCKISPTHKIQLSQMATSYGLTVSELVEKIIGNQYSIYKDAQDAEIRQVASQYSK